MSTQLEKNNKSAVIGVVVSNPEFDHSLYGEGFYRLELRIERLSDQADTIPVVISERMLDMTQDYVGTMFRVTGQFRSHNKAVENGRRMCVLYLFARTIEKVEYVPNNAKANKTRLIGTICKIPTYRKTPLGREICDLVLAVNRGYGKSDYIPCICWGRDAKWASKHNVGDRIVVFGRIQSRVYTKKISENQVEERVAYELSTFRILDEEAFDENEVDMDLEPTPYEDTKKSEKSKKEDEAATEETAEEEAATEAETSEDPGETDAGYEEANETSSEPEVATV